METLSHSESGHLYSWWWDSHISPKNSKWLKENLTDMDAKVKAMIKLIEEDADSFARRAEMYFKKRPELIKLVEEFYRAYRALAERYDHATAELRHAHKTMAKAFPNEANYILTDDSLCDAAESHTQEVPHPICASLEPAFEFSSMHNMSKQNTRTLEEFEDGGSRKGLKQNVKIQNCSESEHPGRAESEVQTLRKALAKIQSDKDAIFLQYQKSLEKLSEMERDLIKAQKDAGGLDERASKYEIEIKILKEALAELKTEKDAGLVQYNQCLESIANLEIMLSMAHMDAKGLDERAGKAEIEAKDLKRELTSEKDAGLLQNKLCLEKISVLEAKITLAEDNSRMLNEQIERAELEVKALRESLAQLNEEKESVAAHYHQCLEQLQTLGLNPECFATSVKDLQNENSKLKEVCKMERDEKEALREKAKDFDELLIENAFMEFSLYGLNAELDELRATVKKLQESCQVLQEEKSIIVAESEKSTLLSQLQTITESMPKLLETNTLLEKSLSDANNELDSLKAKSRRLEESYKSLNDEKYNLLNERSIRVSQLESVEARLGNLEKRFTKLEEKYSDVEMEKESTDNLVEELHDSILVQQEKHANHKPSSEARLRNLVNLVHALQEEQRLGKTEFEEQLDKAVNAQLEMFILQSCIGDLEQKNLALLFECEKHVEASKFSEEVISELETENLMQLMEVEFLSHEIRKFKKGIHQVCGALQIDPDGEHDKGIKQEGIPISHILHNIEDLKSSLVKIQEEKQQLLVKNSVLQTSLWQHRSEGEKLESEKRMLEQEFENMRELNEILQKDKVELLEMNKQLRFEVANGEEKENTLKSDLADLHVELIDLRRTNQVFQEEKSKLLEEKNSLLKSVSDLQDAMSTAEDENSLILQEVLALRNLRFVYECFVTEKVVEQEALSEHLSNLSHMNIDLKQELGVLSNKFEVKEAENAYLNESFERMDKELQEAENANGHLTHQIENSEHLVMKKEAELLEMEKRLKAADMLNAEFCRYIEELKMEQKESRVVKENLDRQILELSENCKSHKKEIEQHRVREETLNSDLLGKTNEFELLEAEAAAFYFDLQILSTSEALLESKVNELTGVCKRLDDESAAKSLVIEQMTERVSLLQSEIGGLKGQLWAYIPVITSLKEDFASLEHTCLLWTNKTCVVGNGEQKGVVIETCLQENSYQSLRENKSTSIPDGVSDLLSMQTRIRAVEKVMTEEIERHVKEENLSANVEAGTLTEVTEDSNLEVVTYDHRNVVMELKELNAWRTKSENWSMMKDIPLDHNSDDPESRYCKREHSGNGDQILELCETSQQCCAPTESDNSERYCPELEVEKELGVDNLELSKATTETTQDGKRKILERLASDAQKLAILNMTVQDLKKKPVTKKKSNKGNDIEHETVKKQIEQVEEAVKELADTNDQLTKDIEESSSSSMGEQVQRRRVTEQARRGSEQIGRLQLEVQNIQYILLKLVKEKNNKGKNRLSRPTGVLLRDFIHIGKKDSRRRSKMCLCGCSRPSIIED